MLPITSPTRVQKRPRTRWLGAAPPWGQAPPLGVRPRLAGPDPEWRDLAPTCSTRRKVFDHAKWRTDYAPRCCPSPPLLGYKRGHERVGWAQPPPGVRLRHLGSDPAWRGLTPSGGTWHRPVRHAAKC